MGDAAVSRPGLGAVQHPFILGLVVDGPGTDRTHVTASIGLRRAERAELDVARAAEHLRQPLADLLVSAVARHRDGGQAGSDERQADARVTPEEFLERNDGAQTAW